MRLKQLAAIPLIFLLAGCPNLLGSSGNTDLNPKILAVTATDGAGKIANTYLEWQPITNATAYRVFLVNGESLDKKQDSEKTTYTQQVGVGATVTFKITAIDAAGNDKVTSSPLSVQVLDSEVGPATDLTIADKPAATDDITSISTGTPFLSWKPADKATHYFVKIYKDGDEKTVYYAAFTKEPRATVGTLPFEDLSVPQYPQVKGNELPTKEFLRVSIYAIRANDPELKAARAFDIKASHAYEVVRKQ